LSSKRNAGRIQRHVVNDLIYKALTRAAVSALKEPQGLVRIDGKRPDSLTLVPWQSGRCATWDITVVDTLAASYVLQSAVDAASAAEIAPSRKEAKYSTLSHSYQFFDNRYNNVANVGMLLLTIAKRGKEEGRGGKVR
jgi:hypothetical protein